MYRGVERRVFTRIDCRLTVRYRAEGAAEEFCTATENISGSGARIMLFKRIPPGTILDLEIFKGNSDSSVRCRGEIMWVSVLEMREKNMVSFEAGIKFISFNLMHIGSLIKDFLIKDAAIPSLN